MKKIFLIVFLVLIDIIAYLYFLDLLNNRKTLEYSFSPNEYLVQTEQIRLNNIEEFNFDNYFKLLCFNDIKYTYYFDDNYLYIELNNGRKYQFNYEIIQPEIIEKIVYKEVEKEVKNEEPHNHIEQNAQIEQYFFVNNEKLFFEKDCDFNVVRETLINNINTTYQTNIDYSRLNISQVGQYSVFYISENKEIEIIVEII